MKSDVSVNADGYYPKRLNQNLLKSLNRNASLNKLEDFIKSLSAKSFVKSFVISFISNLLLIW